ncbi:MAG: MBL fold metallo-hydrolase [bacterium]
MPAQMAQKSIQPTITWIGHATFLIQIGGLNILTDPIFFELSRFFAPRLMPCPLSLEKLPPIDIILVSHNHVDHLDHATICTLKLLGHNPTILAPSGNKDWFMRRGFSKVYEKTWWEKHAQDDFVFTCLPANHWSGRNLLDTNKTLWGSWMIAYKGFHIYFAGDSAYDIHFSQIKKAYPSINVALMPIAPNDPHPLIKVSHINAYEAFKAFHDLGAQQFIPMHWGTFLFEQSQFDHSINLISELWEKQHQKLTGQILKILKIGQSCRFDL